MRNEMWEGDCRLTLALSILGQDFEIGDLKEDLAAGGWIFPSSEIPVVLVDRKLPARELYRSNGSGIDPPPPSRYEPPKSFGPTAIRQRFQATTDWSTMANPPRGKHRYCEMHELYYPSGDQLDAEVLLLLLGPPHTFQACIKFRAVGLFCENCGKTENAQDTTYQHPSNPGDWLGQREEMHTEDGGPGRDQLPELSGIQNQDSIETLDSPMVSTTASPLRPVDSSSSVLHQSSGTPTIPRFAPDNFVVPKRLHDSVFWFSEVEKLVFESEVEEFQLFTIGLGH
ncbi:hypothetical protein R3P38DRAFT_2788168 [Favolaschia claudopus]|uniref:Uncharacterized protein n=1 Tax=Favolaschia claudopus TaxID=2862362 RepID=A0AAW0ALI5_9AGAR